MRNKHGWVGVTLLAMVGLVACSSGSSNSSGSKAGDTGAAGDSRIKAVNVAARAAAFQRPLDAAPSPDGNVIYFLSAGDRGPTVFSVPAAGDATSQVTGGGVLKDPTGIAVAVDGSGVYIADSHAGNTGDGAILFAAAGGTGTPTVLAGTSGRAPKGLDVVRRGSADVIYFTGTDPANGAPGLFSVGSAGGAISTVAEGAPFISPDSVVVSAGGDAFVSDQGHDVGEGVVFRVNNGNLKAVLTNLRLGAPAGVTLAGNDATLLVSAIDTATSSDEVLFLDLATGKTAAATKVVGANKNSSGGLHRAANAPVLAWADVSRSGRVYRVEP